jgi:hypothetical protein
LAIPVYINKIVFVMEYAGICQNVKPDRIPSKKDHGSSGAQAKNGNVTKYGKRWLVRRQGLKKEKEAGLRRIPLQPAA